MLRIAVAIRPLPASGRAIAYGIFQQVVPANAGTHTTRTLASALEQRPFFTFEARGYGSLRSQGRPAERLYEATTASKQLNSVMCDSPAHKGGGSRKSVPRGVRSLLLATALLAALPAAA